ncbi:MAG: DEAD/DEAH box helicase [Cytophagales bacterium]|nr:DEAD/DEAH box helicase [Cytophagales bacterium]
MAQEIHSFEDLKLNRQLLSAIEDLGFDTPSPIQKQAIPLIQAGHDLIGIAQTGTGKTAAFTLPTLMKLKYAQGENPRGIILSPTKELVLQIKEHIIQMAANTDLRCVALYGGVGPKTQIEEIKKGVDILVCTPGRLMEIYAKGALVLKDVNTMILDEADRLMDMGFMPQLRNLLEIIPHKNRQNLLFSATFPEKVEELAGEFLDFPVRVEVTPESTPVETVNQKVYHVPNFRTKINLLEKLFEDEETFHRVMIFANTKEVANNIFSFIERKVTKDVRIIHSNKGQNARINAMKDFEGGDVRFLVATDVSARGIDIKEVSHVINFETPPKYEDYVHRIGRTGRAYHVGEAISFINKAEEYHFKEIQKVIKMNIPVSKLPEDLTVEPTPRQENIDMERVIDKFKRRADPNFKGAFHEKKRKPQNNTSQKSRKGSSSSRGRNKSTRRRR